MHYTIGQWSGLPNYSCTHCPFSTLDEAEILMHIIEKHLPQPPEPEKLPETETSAPEIMHTQELPVLLVTPEQLSNLTKPRSKRRKEN
jgi:hypothetical protein